MSEWLAGLCFDTTSSNNGIHKGAVTLVQKAFDKQLLFLACRHHILEKVAGAVFDLSFTSSGLHNSEVFTQTSLVWHYFPILSLLMKKDLWLKPYTG